MPSVLCWCEVLRVVSGVRRPFQLTLPRYLSCQASTSRTRSARCSETSCAVSNMTAFLPAAAGRPATRARWSSCRIGFTTSSVVGSSGTADGSFHGFLWSQQTGIQDLGAVQDDVASVALGINDRGDVVGISFDVNLMHAPSSDGPGGKPVDLNSIIPAGSPLFLRRSGAQPIVPP